MRTRALAFDLDGTLVNSRIDFKSMREQLRVHDEDDVLTHVSQLDENGRLQAYAIIHAHEVAGAKASTLIDGVSAFLEFAKSSSLPFAIFTRNSRETALWTLNFHGLDCDLLIAREDAEPKPAPDGLFKIAQHFGVEPAELLFVGDYRYDLEAGLRAQVPTALYLNEPADFETAGASFIFKSYRELSDWLSATADAKL